MALALNDRVQQTGTANTTVSFTLTGSVAGFQSFAVIGNGNTTYYAATDAGGNWEVGIGTYATSGPTLTRTTILASSNSGSAVTFSGSVNVFVTYPAEKSINYDANGVATIGSTLSYSDTGIISSFASTTAGYNQVILQNKSNATNASANLNVSNDVSTSSSGYAELGINSSTFTGSGSFNLPSASYLASASTDLTVGTYGAYNVHFVTNSNTTDSMTIFSSGGVSLGGQPDPGLGTLYANNVYLGFTTITAAAGTTVLTNSSSGWQQVVGTTTQTIQLPNATTLYKGLAYTIANNSTGAVTIKDNASTTLDTTVTGGSSILVLTNNSTSAGTWVAYSYIPSSYDFSTTTANFGGATITNSLWNGTTIATGYGGTGLTSFGAANNAIYSTSSSALAAGTLPIAAGGTAATTFTANGVIYGNGTSALGVTGAGTTGQVLLANTSGAPTWGSVPSTGAVTTFQTSLSGLTPSSATSGAVTLAGTLGTSSGGTNLTSFTSGGALYATSTSVLTTGTLPATSGGTGTATTAVGDLLQGAATNTWSKLAAVATGNALISGGVTTASSWGKIGLTTHVSGTLPIANGGTNLTAYTTGDIIYASATNTLSTLGIGSTNQVLTVAGGIPTWAATQSTMVYPGTGIPNSTGSAWGTSYSTTGSGTVVALATSPTFVTSITAPLHLGGTTASSTLTLQSTSGVGTTDSIALKVGNNGATTGLSISSAGVTTLSSALPVASGGTGQTSYTDGQLLIGNSTGNTLTKASLTAGTGISITPGSGSISIASTVTAGLTITNDTTTSSALYPTFTSATSGSITGASVTSTKLKFVPSTGTLTAPNVEASNGMLVNSATVSTNYSIPSGSNAIAVGPVTVAAGAAVTIPSGSRWLVL